MLRGRLIRDVRSLAIIFVLCSASDARADWFLAAYTGAAHTSSNTLTLAAPDLLSTEIGPVGYRGEAFKSPIYYGYRVGWAPALRGVGLEAEFTHAKTIGTTHSTLLPDFQQSHGLNFLLANITFRQPLASSRVIVVGRGGAGITLPHVEGTFRGVHTESYQYGGAAWSAGIGLEVPLRGGLSAIVDARFIRASEQIAVAGATIDGVFQTRHVDVGIAWRFPH